MDKLLPLPEVGRKLGISPTNARKLHRAGLIQSDQVLAGRVYVPESEVARLQATPVVKVGEPVLQVRIGVDTDPSDTEQIRQWWPVADPDAVVGHLLAATVAGWVVRVLRITGYQTSAGRRSFEVSDDIGKSGKSLLGHRWPSLRGPVAKVWLPE